MSHLYRFYAQPEPNEPTQVILRDEEAHHALHVLRLKVGAEVGVFDGQGNDWTCRVEECSRKELTCRVLEHCYTEPAESKVIVSLAWLNKDKAVEALIQRCTELGVGEFRFFRGEHSGRAPKSSPKWEKWAVESCKQCGRVWVPQCSVAEGLAEVLRDGETTLVASLGEDALALRDSIDPGRDINIVIGPEGDFSEGELAQLIRLEARPISLGDATYRSEVAAGVMSALVMYELGRLG